MSRAKLNKIYRQFLKGLVTEASALTYPENATTSESNCTLERRGNRGRRLGIATESSGQVTPISLGSGAVGEDAITEYKWESVAGESGTDFLCVQLGVYVHFISMGGDALSDGVSSLNIDLTPYVTSGIINPSTYPISMASGKGYLFIVGEHIDPILVSFDRTLRTVSSERIYIQIRDFRGVNDGLANDEEPATLSAAHEYNLKNQGWVSPANDGTGASVTYYDFYGSSGTYAAPTSAPITSYFTSVSRYPPNNKQWWVAKDTSNNFDPAALAKIFMGNNRAPRGHFILDAFRQDRSSVSGVAGLTIEDTFERPRTVGFFSGRVWYATNSTVYFSQILDDKRRAGFCYQEADPTAEDISDIVATDGGAIPIPEMSKALRLVPAGNGILVFSTNGIWMVSGTSSGFSATDISVSKVSQIGTDSPLSIVEAGGQFYWWSKVGIMGMSQKVGVFGPIEGSFDRTNISEQTIQTFFNDIPADNKRYVKSTFDAATNTVQWLFGTDTTGYSYDSILNLDLGLQAFYPWKISTDEESPVLIGLVLTPSINDIGIDIARRNTKTFVKYLSSNPGSGSERFLCFNSFRDTSFQDWGTLPYTSFIETGFEILDDAMRDKQITYLITYLQRTEEEVASDGTPTHQSSCKLTTKFDWADDPVSGKWANSVEIYRLPLGLLGSVGDPITTGYPIVTTKHKVRGSGKAIQFRFGSEEVDKDFDIIGWACQFSGGTEV